MIQRNKGRVTDIILVKQIVSETWGRKKLLGWNCGIRGLKLIGEMEVCGVVRTTTVLNVECKRASPAGGS